MESSLNLSTLFSKALRSEEYSEYYFTLAEATPEEFLEFESTWTDSALSDESIKRLNYYRVINEGYLFIPGAYEYPFDVITRNINEPSIEPIHEEIIDRIFIAHVCPNIVSTAIQKMRLVEGARDPKNRLNSAREQVLSMTATEFDILLLLEATLHGMSKMEARKELARLLSLDMAEV